MELEEFKNNQNRKWERKVYKSCIGIILVIFTLELLTFLIYLKNGYHNDPIPIYLLRRVITPVGTMIISMIFTHKILYDDKNSMQKRRNCMMANIMILCGVTATFHGFYFILWMTPAIGLLYSSVFNDYKLLRNVFIGAMSEVIAAFLISVLEAKHSLDIAISYLFVASILICFEYFIAKQMIRHHLRIQEYIYQAIVSQMGLIEQMSIEPMTRLYNHATFEKNVNQLVDSLASQSQENQNYLLMLDLDFFKKVNDTYGHLCGDEVLITVAKIIKEVVAQNGTVYRYGGEEFSAILENIEFEKAYRLAEEIREKVGSTHFDFCHGKPITVSIGMASYKTEQTAFNWIQEADGRLYEAKKKGRNRVII